MLATVKAHYDGKKIVLDESVFAQWVAGQDLSITYNIDEKVDWNTRVAQRNAYLAELASANAPHCIGENEIEAFIATLREERDV